MEIDSIIRKYALANAVDHEGQAQPKAVLGKVLAENPELRERIMEIRERVEEIVADINSLSLEKQKEELKNVGYVAIKKEDKKDLPALDIKKKLVLRFAPNPDGALHLGNARPAILCDEYAKRYKGKLILRFDDTDPKVKVPEKIFYSWIKEDLNWLGIKWHQEVAASKRLPIYYKYAEKLVKMNKAYVCTCDQKKWKSIRDAGKSCPCREIDSKTNYKKWKKMFKGYKEGEAVLRVKTDMQAKNPAVRDWAAFRIVDKPLHPLQKKKLWPLYNFASAVDDYLLEVTHIFRGQEHSTNEAKQRYLYQHFKWEYPEVVLLGRFSMSDIVLSKSVIREGIRNKQFRGWDDPKLGTLRSMRRRGIQKDAIRNIIIDIGPKPNDITLSMENLSSYNRKLIDKKANRYFFIPNPKRITIKNFRIKNIAIPLHPESKKGFRKMKLTKTFYIDTEDFNSYKNLEVRLKDLCNIKLDENSEFLGREVRPLPKIQWVPEKHISVRVVMPEREQNGYGEPTLSKAKKGEIIQFERFGFVRVEKVTSKKVSVVFAHN